MYVCMYVYIYIYIYIHTHSKFEQYNAIVCLVKQIQIKTPRFARRIYLCTSYDSTSVIEIICFL